MPCEIPRRCLAVIPARGGSTRVKRKNIRLLQGKPALAYTIAAAIDSRLFHRVIVSTDDEEIAAEARRYGAETPFLRDARLADGETPVSAVTIDALERLDPRGTEYRAVAQLMANCPLRTAADVVSSHRQFALTEAESQISVTRFGWQNPWWAATRGECFVLAPLFDDLSQYRSQDLPELFCPTGAVWWAIASVLRRSGTYHIPGRTGWEIPWVRGVDIDTEEDWQMAEFLMLGIDRGSEGAD